MTSEVTQALLPCPFCGGKAERFTLPEDEFGNGGGDVITCSRCQASSHVEFGRKENLVDRWNTRLTAQSGEGRRGAGEDAVAVGLAEQVAEAMDDDGGSWRSCTGCHETNEGYSTGHFPYSAALKCELGSGCRECGGIGAVWDDTDYADMADFIAAADRDHANIKRILIENDIQPYRAEQIAMAITELEIPAALNARQSGEGEREATLEAALWSVLSYDQLLRQYEGPQAILFAGDVEKIDATYDAMIAKVTAALRATDDAGGAL